MALNLTSIVASAIRVLFGLGPDIVKAATYFRSAGLNVSNGVVYEDAADTPCSVIVVGVPFRADFVGREYRRKVTVQKEEIEIIVDGPLRGDYLILTETGQRLDIVAAPSLDSTGQLYTLLTVDAVADDDWGDLAAHTSSDDWGGLTASSNDEDRGALFE